MDLKQLLQIGIVFDSFQAFGKCLMITKKAGREAKTMRYTTFLEKTAILGEALNKR